MIFLENEHLKISLASKGAEMQSLVSKKDNINYLWDGNPDYWGKFSPVLFPIVGGLKHHIYHYKGKTYQLPRHGFARDMEFSVAQHTATEVVFELKPTAETLKVYPFQFILQLRYKLSGYSVACTYHVSNPGSSPLLFSIGGHPAFATPVNKEISYNDYYLQFNKEDELTFHKITQDLIDNETISIPLTAGKLPLQHQLFYDDALVVKSLKSDVISLRNSKNEHGIHFSFSNFPFFGIWAAKDANFVCLEPWCGIADGIDHQQELEQKEGIVQLAPQQTFERTWEVTCF